MTTFYVIKQTTPSFPVDKKNKKSNLIKISKNSFLPFDEPSAVSQRRRLHRNDPMSGGTIHNKEGGARALREEFVYNLKNLISISLIFKSRVGQLFTAKA